MSRTSDAFRWLNLLAILLSIGVGCTLCAAGVIRAMARCTACISSGVALLIAGLGVVALEIVGYSELVLFYRQWHGKGALFIVLAAFVLSDAVLELAFAIGIASVGVLFVVFRFVLSDPEPLLGSKHMYFYDRTDPNAKVSSLSSRRLPLTTELTLTATHTRSAVRASDFEAKPATERRVGRSGRSARNLCGARAKVGSVKDQSAAAGIAQQRKQEVKNPKQKHRSKRVSCLSRRSVTLDLTSNPFVCVCAEQ